MLECIIPMFLNCSTCFGRHTVHHQELRWLSHRSGRQPKTYVKPEAAIIVFDLLMMGGVSPEACWAIKIHWNNKFYYTVASCWFFLWDLHYDARIHEHQTYRQVINPLKGRNDSNTRGWSRKIQISFMIKLVADWPRKMPATVRWRVFVFQLFKVIRINIYRTTILPFLSLLHRARCFKPCPLD
jgi:hypothetical protein